MACEADYVFIPESPVADGWQDQLCNKLRQVTPNSLDSIYTQLY